MLRYYDLGISTLLLKGFDPLADAVDFGERLLPLVREGAEQRGRGRSCADRPGLPHPEGQSGAERTRGAEQ